MPKDIRGFLETANIAKLSGIGSDTLSTIGARVVEDYKLDRESRRSWEDRRAQSMKLATQVLEAKNKPWPGAANIKYPLLSTACVQFAARAYPNMVTGRGIVKCKIIGDDPGGVKAGKADRTQHHMNYQLLDEMVEWETEMDRLLTALPVEGTEYKKTYFDPILGRNCSKLVRPANLVMYYYTENMERAVRITEHLWFTKNEAIEKIRSGLWLDIEDDLGPAPTTDDRLEIYGMTTRGDAPTHQDEDAPHLFLEQHRFWDLDGDGYQEPYIITVHKETMKVVRITARWDYDSIKFTDRGKVAYIKPTHYYTKYYFMPSLDGSIYEMGFGDLLTPINETINTSINQMLDAGTLANNLSGMIGIEALGRGKTSGTIKLKLGEFLAVPHRGDDLRKSIVPLQFPGPSAVLFNLLGLMVESGEKLANVTEPLLGETPPANTPVGTTMALIEQGMKVFTSIYKRIHRSLKDELRKLFSLNRRYLNPQVYFTVMDNPRSVKQIDYDEKSVDIIPVSDPSEVTDVLRMMKAQYLQSLGPMVDQDKITDYSLQVADIPDYEDFKAKQPPPIPPEVQVQMAELQLKEKHFQLDVMEARARMSELQSRVMLNIAKAEGVAGKITADRYKTLMQHIDAQAKIAVDKQLGMKKAEKQANSTQKKGEKS